MTETTPSPETGCCPRFDPSPWEDKEVEFVDRLFLKDRVRSFLHFPLNFGRVMVRCMSKIEAAGAKEKEQLLLCDENSLWGADLYIAISKEIPDAETVRISGKYLSKVFEGPYRDIRKWVKTMCGHVAAKGKSLEKMLFYYTTCPRCAKVYGKNFVVLLAQV
ncbi:MAG: hydrolase [Planctomycetota bacterium]